MRQLILVGKYYCLTHLYDLPGGGIEALRRFRPDSVLVLPGRENRALDISTSYWQLLTYLTRTASSLSLLFLVWSLLDLALTEAGILA